jgi:hypothetical protein
MDGGAPLEADPFTVGVSHDEGADRQEFFSV